MISLPLRAQPALFVAIGQSTGRAGLNRFRQTMRTDLLLRAETTTPCPTAVALIHYGCIAQFVAEYCERKYALP